MEDGESTNEAREKQNDVVGSTSSGKSLAKDAAKKFVKALDFSFLTWGEERDEKRQAPAPSLPTPPGSTTSSNDIRKYFPPVSNDAGTNHSRHNKEGNLARIKDVYKKANKQTEIQSSYLRGRHREYIVPVRRPSHRERSPSNERSRSRSPVRRRGCMMPADDWTIPSPPHKQRYYKDLKAPYPTPKNLGWKKNDDRGTGGNIHAALSPESYQLQRLKALSLGH